MSDDVEVTPELLDALTMAAEGATNGVWIYQGGMILGGRHGDHWTTIARPTATVSSCVGCSVWRNTEVNGRYIALANPLTVMALVKRIRELEADIEDLHERARDEAWERDLNG